MLIWAPQIWAPLIWTSDAGAVAPSAVLKDQALEARARDVLLVDDIQFLIRGEQTANEFFHTFNALHQNGKQIVMTCDSPPGELQGLEERLISRFQWGLVSSIEPPDLETRIAILQKKAEINGIHLPEEVATFLGNYISSNIRELEGALNHIMAYCAVNQTELSVDAARKIVKERSTQETSHLSIEGIQKMVAKHFDLTPELLIGKTRKQEVASPRQSAMYLSSGTPRALSRLSASISATVTTARSSTPCRRSTGNAGKIPAMPASFNPSQKSFSSTPLSDL